MGKRYIMNYSDIFNNVFFLHSVDNEPWEDEKNPQTAGDRKDACQDRNPKSILIKVMNADIYWYKGNKDNIGDDQTYTD